MKYRLTFVCGEPVSLPVQHHKILQAALLAWLGNEQYVSFLHNQGYEREKRTYKLYTFSRIFGRNNQDKKNRKIIFYGKVQLYVSFYTEESHQMIVQNFLEKKPLILGNHLLQLYDCELAQEVYEPCLVDTASAVTIHSTPQLSDGRKKTYYYNPWENDFSEMIRQNLVRKYQAFYGEEPKEAAFKIVPDGKMKGTTIYYNRFVIRGWNGSFRIYGAEEMIKMALLSGIGARNGIGLGCLLQREIL
ncbi:MAG: CRISPR-associated endoribonuclease Cas6 [Lachnospiraceae bacterium]|nr:CRISPR-associated endoribonuclease Cas6 [Lachnospiraceae bacterium]